MTVVRRALGLMSGTSMDGIDAALLSTDGTTIAGFDATLSISYSDDERTALRAAVAAARGMTDRNARPPALAAAEAIVTERHIAAVAALLQKAELSPAEIDVIGFHGQTVFHDAAAGITVQLGDGQELANASGIPVVCDFRAADVAAGGEGAPFVPAYHLALADFAGLKRPAVIVNIGGVANITIIAEDGTIAACDTGPGNALLDDFMRARTGAAMDEGGRASAAGAVDASVLAELLDDPFFLLPAPKSLDRDHFSAAPVKDLSVLDGAATLTAFTAHSIAEAIARQAGAAAAVIVCGGGTRNPTLMAMLQSALSAPLSSADEAGWSAEFTEAQAFAYLAVRSLLGLPLTFPGTTGVAEPMTGGVLVRPGGG